MTTKELIIETIDRRIKKTRSRRKKRLGLPRLRADMDGINDRDYTKMLLLLWNAVSEPEPTGKNALDSESMYWVNRHSTSSHRGGDRKTWTRQNLDKIITLLKAGWYVAAPRPVQPVKLGKETQINTAKVNGMRASSRRADGEIVLGGHGETCINDQKITVPRGTTVKFYSFPLGMLTGVCVPAIYAPEVWGRLEVPRVCQVACEGAVIYDHKFGELNFMGLGNLASTANELGGTWMRGNQTRTLSSILKRNMGTVHWAACRAHPDDDEISWERRSPGMVTGLYPYNLTAEQQSRLVTAGGVP